MIFAGNVMGQKSIKKDADRYFKNGNYFQALKLYNIYDKINTSKDALYNRAICNYECHKIPQAKADLNRLVALRFDKKDLYYYLGLTNFAENDFKNAAIFFKKYLRYSENKDQRADIVRKIKQCAYGIDHAYDDQIAFVENLGDVVNSKYNEFNAIQSPNYNDRYYFSSNREGSTGGLRNEKGLKDDILGSYFLDILVAESSNGIWQNPSSIDPLLNSPKNDRILDFSSDGSILFYKKSLTDLSKGTILVDTFKAGRDPGVFPSQLISPIVGELGDDYLTVFDDSTFVFSSKRAGGYGGYDLYVVGFRDGDWTLPFNLGPKINSRYDEVSPFVSNDGKTLFLSSNRNEGFGGYDIFSTQFDQEKSSWKPLSNLGLPINSTADDLYYRLSNNGMTATLSSNRKKGEGGFDLYIAYLTKQNMTQLTYSSSFPYFENSYEKYLEQLIENPEIDPSTLSEIVLEESNEEEVVETKQREVVISSFFYGDDDNVLTPQNLVKFKDIKDLMIIYPDLKIRLVSHSIAEGLPNYDLYFSIKRAEKIRDYMVSQGSDPKRFQLLACGPNYPSVKNELAGKKIALAEKINRRIDIDILNAEEVNLKVIKDKPVVAEYLKDYKNDLFYTNLEGLSYRVQIAKVNQMYQNPIVSKSDDVIIEEENGAYVYTIGLVSDFESAKRVKDLLVRSELNDTKITAYLDGIRIERNDLPLKVEQYPDLANFLSYLNQ